jgi:voltage-gated sodium channel
MPDTDALKDPSSLRGRLALLLRTPLVERGVVALILINAVTLGLETSDSAMASFGGLLHAIDQAILAIFVVELAVRMFVYRARFFTDPWSVFDFIVVAIALLPATGSLSVLRALRILRVLRLVTALPSLRKVVAGLVGALPGMGSIGLLLVLVYYVFSVMATKLFGQTNPELFGTIGTSAYTLFQAMTFDDWSNGIAKPLAEQGNTWGWAFVMFFMVVSAFMVLNLFIGVVVTALDDVTSDGSPKVSHPMHEQEVLLGEVRALRREVQELRAALPAARDPA